MILRVKCSTIISVFYVNGYISEKRRFPVRAYIRLFLWRGETLLNIYDISKQAGVSIATVSRVLNGSSSVKPKTRKKVLDVIEKCGYTPNAFARGLGLDSMNSIGILCADCSDIYLAKAVYYIEGNLREGGYNCILRCCGYDLPNKQRAVNLLLAQRVDALIMVGYSFIEANPEDNKYISDAAAQVPVLMLNADFDCPNVFCTMCDDFKATLEATLALLHSGIEDVLYLYNSRSHSGLKKLSGYQAAFTSKDIPINKQLIQFYQGSREDIPGVCRFLNELKDQGITFHAVLASDDMLAAGAVKYAKSQGLTIPDELSVIGFNNSLLTECSEPAITSIDNHLETLCSQLVKICISTLNGEEMPQKTIFSGELIQKATTNLK